MLKIHLISTSVREALVCRDTAGGAARYRMDPCLTPALHWCLCTLNFSRHIIDHIYTLRRRRHILC